MKKLFSGVAILLLSACSTINQDAYVVGWPEMQITRHESYLGEINYQCWGYLPLWQKLMGAVSFGCTVYDLDKKTCDIYTAPGSSQNIIDHEEAHCKGGDHNGGDLQEVFDHWLDVHNKPNIRQSTTPPQLITDPENKQNIIWDNASKFGPVPDSVMAKALELCGNRNLSRDPMTPVGYHAFAKDLQGKRFMEGGFLCGLKKDQDPRIAAVPVIRR